MTKRNLLKMFVLAGVTFGAYYLWWFYATYNELVLKGARIPAFRYFLIPVFSIAAIIVNLLLIQVLPGSFDAVLIPLGYLFVAAQFIGIGIAIWWMWHFCGAIHQATKGKFEQGIAFWSFIGMSCLGLATFWPLIAQDYFNRSTISIPRHYKKTDLNKRGQFKG